MNKFPAPPHQKFSCWNEDGSERAPDPYFEPSEGLFRGFTIQDLESPGGPMPGISFNLQGGCSVNREKYSKWEALTGGHSHMGVLRVTVEMILVGLDELNKRWETEIEHLPALKFDNYAHADIRLVSGTEKAPRSVRAAWRLLIDEHINGDNSNSEAWKRLCLQMPIPRPKP